MINSVKAPRQPNNLQNAQQHGKGAKRGEGFQNKPRDQRCRAGLCGRAMILRTFIALIDHRWCIRQLRRLRVNADNCEP